jgi:cytochrome P450
LTIFLASVLSKKAPRGLRRPPGPRGLPLIGSTLQLGKEPQQQLLEWTAKYGEIFQVQLGLENWVFLSSPGAVKDIMDKQSSITSGRPPQPVVSELVSNNMRLVMMSYTPEWRKLRTIVHKLLTPKSSNSFKPSQEFEAKQLIYDLLTRNDSLEEFYMHVRRYTTSVIMTATYGKRVPVWVSAHRVSQSELARTESHIHLPGNRTVTMFWKSTG